MINLNEIKTQHTKLRRLLFLSYILFTISIFGTLFFVHEHYSSKHGLINFQKEAEKNGKKEASFFENIYQHSINTIYSIRDNKQFQSFIQNQKNQEDVNDLFLTLMKSNSSYMQLRFIDKNGNEIIRYDRKNIGAAPFAIQSKFLQNKADRYYFQVLKKQNKNHVWFSPIDLNIERKKIQKPITPVLRAGLPIYTNNTFQGTLIINIFMKDNLEHLIQLAGYDIYIADQDGYFLLTPNEKYNWSKYFNKEITAKKILDISTKHLQSKHAHMIMEKEIYINPLSIQSENPIYLIYLENEHKKDEMSQYIIKRILYTFLFILLIAFPGAYFASSSINTIFKTLQKKSDELGEIASNLEAQVKKEVEKNAHKDRLLENTSKLAALGEMIGNIAHQWRHPLTRLSLIIQNLQPNQTDDKTLKAFTKTALEQIDYMSDTVEDFRNFYKNDTQKSYFEPNLAIQRAIKIVGATIKHKGISIAICIETPCKIYGFPNQFAQVILNLINNSKEALEENSIKNPHIRLHVSCKNDQCEINIEDNALGISDAIIDDIFQPRFSTKQNGSGIGLYMSRMIIEENFNGTINAKNINNGASFTITVPL